MDSDLVMWGTVFAAVGAVASAFIAYLVFLEQSEPQVVVYTTTFKETPSIIYLIIENIGKSPARNICFHLSRSLPEKAWGFEQDPAKQQAHKIMDDGPLIQGIAFLPPGVSRKLMWGQYWGLFHALNGQSVIVRASYSSRPKAWLVSHHHTTESILEVNSYTGTDASNNDPLDKIAKGVEKIARALDHSSSGFRPLGIKVIVPEKLDP